MSTQAVIQNFSWMREVDIAIILMYWFHCSWSLKSYKLSGSGSRFFCTYAMLESEGGGEGLVWYDGWEGGCLFGREHLLKGECLFNEIWYTHN